MNRDNPVIKVEQLTVNYDKTPVLWDINFTIDRGMIVGVVGPNGAGKSTLLKTLLGMIAPLSGNIEFFGKPFTEVRKKIAYVPQRSSVDWDFPITAKELVLMGRYGHLGLFKWQSKKDHKIAEEAMERVGMLSFADRQIGKLSGGQQQRIFIARALAQDADIYMMDEPFAGVDNGTEKELVALFEELASQGKTLIIVHHDLSTVDRYFKWLLMLNTCLVASGPVSEVFHRDHLLRTYGKGSMLLDEAARISQNTTAGLK
ncbi:MAG: metal ABC transporter ATP-binding protein [Chlamydiales bacterium]|nr:metal ABC transporter ATP-binding protein [Chlamydiales bacterium]